MKQYLMKRLRLFGMVITLTLLLPIQALSQFNGAGKGTETSPFKISTPEQLDQMRNFANVSGVYFELTNDIDLTEWISQKYPTDGWRPISEFSGTFNGNNHCISGLSSILGGLFSSTTNAHIHNLSLIVDISGSDIMTGGLVDIASNSELSDIKVSGTIKGDEVGGICGVAMNSALKNCQFYSGVISGFSYAGGIAGELVYLNDIVNTLKNIELHLSDLSVNDAILESSDTKNGWVGGLFGRIKNQPFLKKEGGFTPAVASEIFSQTITLDGLYSNATIIGGNYSGGIIGGVLSISFYNPEIFGYYSGVETIPVHTINSDVVIRNCTSESNSVTDNTFGSIVGEADANIAGLEVGQSADETFTRFAHITLDNCVTSGSYILETNKEADYVGVSSIDCGTLDLDNCYRRPAAMFLGNGTKASPYQIRNANELASIDKAAYYKLMTDIDLSSISNWSPIGSHHGVVCYLDGDNHVISGLQISDSTATTSGLFANLIYGSVENLIIRDAKVNGKEFTGILAAQLTNSTVTNCEVSGIVNGSTYTGGIAGKLISSSIRNVRINADIMGVRYAGGIAAEADSLSNIESCLSMGLVSTNGIEGHAGGIVAINSGTVSDSYSTSSVESAKYAGGIAAVNNGSISRCHVSGNIKSDNYAGGIAACNNGKDASVIGCLAANEKIELSGSSAVGNRIIGCVENGASNPETSDNRGYADMVISLGNTDKQTTDDALNGLSVSNSEMTYANTYTSMNWNLEETWGLVEDEKLPYLLALGKTANGSMLPSMYLAMESVETSAGNQFSIPVILKNTEETSGLQFDIALPDGITIATDRNRPQITAGSRLNTSTHSIASRMGGDGMMRVLISSRGQTTAIEGSNGDVAKIVFNVDSALAAGEYNIELKNVFFSTMSNKSITGKNCKNEVIVRNDSLTASDIDAFIGKTFTMPVYLTNLSDIAGFSFDVVLPEGISIAQNGVVTTNRTKGLKPGYVMASDNVASIFCKPGENAVEGNSGELVTIEFNVDENCIGGEYTMQFKNIYLINTDSCSIKSNDFNSTISIKRFVRKGDINTDGIITQSDINALAEIIIGIEDESYAIEAADLNDSGDIDVKDMTLEVNLAFEESFNPSAVRRMTRDVNKTTAGDWEYANMRLYIEPFSIQPGETKPIKLHLYNPDDYVYSFQFVTKLPEGLEFVKVRDGESFLKSTPSDRAETDLNIYGNLRKEGWSIIGYNGGSLYDFLDSDGYICELYIHASETAIPGIYSTPITEIKLTDSTAECSYLVYDNNYSVIVGDLSENETIAIEGFLSDESVNDINGSLANNSVLTELNLEGVLDNKSTLSIVSGNPNMLIFAKENVTYANTSNVVSNGYCDKLNLTDGYNFEAAKSFVAGEAKYTRTLEPSIWESIYLPFTADEQNGITFGSVVRTVVNDANLFSVEECAQAANKPCLVCSTTGGDIVLSASQVTIDPESNSSDNDAVGTYHHTTSANDVYAVSGSSNELKLEKVNELLPFRGYLTKEFVESDNTAGIEDLIFDNHGIETIYNLQGIRINTPVKELPSGFYIINGKKVFIRN